MATSQGNGNSKDSRSWKRKKMVKDGGKTLQQQIKKQCKIGPIIKRIKHHELKKVNKVELAHRSRNITEKITKG